MEIEKIKLEKGVYLSLLVLLVSFILFFNVGVVYAEVYKNASLNVSASIPSKMDWAEIELNTTEIDFGEINMSGYANDKRKSQYYEIRNKGNIDIRVTPVLSDESDKIFSHLRFARILSDPLSEWRQIGNYSLRMNKTNGDWSDWKRYAIRLDLNNYNEDIPFDIINHKNRVIFWATPIDE